MALFVYAGFQENSRVDALTRGSLYLQKLGKEGQRLAATSKTTNAVDQKKATGKQIRDMVKLADLEGLKQLLPPVKGCALQLLQSRHQYTAFYSVVRPGSRSKTLGGGSSVISRYAEQFLIWAWAQHALVTSRRCPHNFDECI